MSRIEYRDLLSTHGYSDEQISACERGVALLEEYLSVLPDPITLDSVTAERVRLFAASMIDRGLNEHNGFVGIYVYADMIENRDLQVAILDLFDGFEILGNLYRAIGEELGAEAQARIFEGVELPPLGTTPLEWTRVNAVVFPRLESMADAATVRRILRSGLRNLPDADYLPIRERYEEFDDIDAFLDDRGRRHLDALTNHRDEGSLYIGQMIDDAVLQFVRSNPEIGRGVRRGTTILETKIPHQSIEYLAADDLATKQYRVCHCPVVKESMVHDDLEISSTFCDFCPSFNAKPWEVIFGHKLEYDVLESARRGGRWCRFAIHLPEDALR